MELRTQKSIFVLLSGVLFTFLFYQAALGLNLVLWELSVFTLGFLLYKEKAPKTREFWLFASLFLISMLAVLISHTAFSITINIIVFVQIMAMNLWSDMVKIQYGLFASVANSIPSVIKGFNVVFKIKRPSLFKKWLGLWMTIASILIIWLFVVLYSSANSYFASIVNDISNSIYRFFDALFSFKHADLLLYFIPGMIFASALLIRTTISQKYGFNKNPGANLVRIRRKGNSSGMNISFLRWFRTGVFLMAILNVLILIFNYLDLVHVWFRFEWTGQLLREFVHEGTWTLVFSVALSAVLAVAFFNGNIHFFSKNAKLKWLVKIWVIQNIFMIVSVFIRNCRYVGYYNLADLRIGVFIFLLIAAFSMILLLQKIIRGNSMYWLLRRSFVFAIVVLTVTSAVNWNRVIARYNLAHRNDAYFHYDYMAMLPYQTLDILQENKELFNFPYDSSRYHSYTSEVYGGGTVEFYSEIIDKRTESLKIWMQQKDWREWNFADWNAWRRVN